jgi:nitroreductase
MELEQVIKNRCSVRHFSSKKVEQDKIDKIIEYSLLAPTAKNKQPFRIYILKSKEAIEKIDTLTNCRYNAPIVALFTYKDNEMWVNDEISTINSGIEDASIVATHFMLEAYNLGLDTCWVNIFNNYKLEKEFKLPKDEHSVLLMPIGYRLDGVRPSKLHTLKRNKEELVKEL